MNYSSSRGALALFALSFLALITLPANAQNQRPYAHPQSVAVRTNTPTLITLTGDDDADYIGSATNYHYSPNPRDIPVLSFTLLSNPTNGVLSGTAPNLTYTPTVLSGYDSFTFKVNDGALDSTNLATVQILITNRVGAVRWSPGTALLRSDDGFELWTFAAGSSNSDRLSRAVRFKLAGSIYNSFYVNNNGNISFGTANASYSPTPFPNPSGARVIAPFMADVDTRHAQSGMITVSKGFVRGRVATTITWPGVGYYSMMADKTNTFQLVLIDRSDFSPGDMEVEFNYNDINWLWGSASGNQYPIVGWDAGDMVNYYNVPGSGTAAVTNLPTSSNFSPPFPGRLRFLFSQASAPVVGNTAASTAINTATVNADILVKWAGAEVVCHYGTVSNALSSSVTITNIPYGISNTVSVSTVLSNLFPGQTYFYTVNASSERGNTNSAIQSFTTLPDPVITYMSPTNGPSSGGTLVTLIGNGFVAGSMVTFNGTTCVITNHTMTQLQFFTPAGMGTSNIVQVTVGETVSDPAMFNYNPPSITFASSSPTSGNTLANLSGTSFGTSGTVLFNGVPCPVSSYSHNQIEFTIPPGQGSGHTITVTAGGQTSAPFAFSYQAPNILSVTPASGPTAGGITVVVTGSNFGTNSTVTLGGKPCTVVGNTHTSISFLLPAGQGLNLPLEINVSGQSAVKANAFSYAAPAIIAHTPGNGPTIGGTIVTLSGTNFGTSASVTLGGTPCAIDSSSHAHISFFTPAGQGTDLPIQVTVAGQASNLRLFDFDSPVINAIAPTNGPSAGGTIVSMNGINFGTNATVLFNGTPCTLVSPNSHSAIQFYVPAGQGTGHTIQLNVGGQLSATKVFNYDAPTISTVVSTNSATVGGSTVTLMGSSFGTSGTVLFDGNPCSVTSYTHSQIQFTLPAGQGLGHTIVVSSAGQTSNVKLFDYAPPSGVQLFPANGPASGGITITAVGMSFGTNATVTMGGNPVSITASNHASVQFTLPAGQGLNVPVIVTASGQSSAPALFHYDAPVITFLSPAIGFEAGGTLMTLHGLNFGTNGIVTVDGNPCIISNYSNTEIKCLTPAGSGTDRTVTVSVSGQTSNSKLFTYLSDPHIYTHPADQTTFLKGSAAFSVVATGSAPLRYQWQKVDGLNVTNLFRATNATLVFPSTGTNHAGVYRVQVSSGASSTLSDTATLTVLGFGSVKPAAGQYYGLFFETNQVSHHSSGYIQLKLTTNAVCSGKLLVDGDSVPFTTKVNPAGLTTKAIPRLKWGKEPIMLSLAFDLTNGTDVVTGSVVSSNLWSADLTADRNVFSKTNPATEFAADYALLFSSATRGEGIGRGLVRTNGTIGMTMHLRDGSKTKQGSFVSKNGQVPMYAFLYPGIDVITNGATLKTNRNYKGSLFGWILLETNGPTGNAAWIKTGTTGFTNELSVDGWR